MTDKRKKYLSDILIAIEKKTMKKQLIYIAIGICAFLIGILLFDADIFAISLIK